MWCEEHVSEYYTSFCDNMSAILNGGGVRRNLAEACELRYRRTVKNCRRMILLVNFLATLVRDRDLFMSLWTSDSAMIRNRKLPENLRLRLEGEERFDVSSMDAFGKFLNEQIDVDFELVDD